MAEGEFLTAIQFDKAVRIFRSFGAEEGEGARCPGLEITFVGFGRPELSLHRWT
jgi:hypothetical protein